jgi:hypothetical protein
LNLEIGGPSALPYQPANYYENLQFPDRDYVADKDERQYRRGVYTHWQAHVFCIRCLRTSTRHRVKKPPARDRRQHSASKHSRCSMIQHSSKPRALSPPKLARQRCEHRC